MSTPILVYTCDAYSWCLKPFLYLLDTYFSTEQLLIIGGCKPIFEVTNVRWLDVESRTKERWSDGLIDCLNQMNEDIFIWTLEDFWLCRSVNLAAISSLAEYMSMHPDILRMDLTADRLHSGAAVDVDSWGHCDIISTEWGTPYNLSTQMGLWSRKHLLGLLKQELSPWDFELQDIKLPSLRIMGTRNAPVRYINGVGQGLPSEYKYRTVHIRDGIGGRMIDRIPQEHVDIMLENGILPTGGYFG